MFSKTNVYEQGTGRAEVANCVLSNSRCRGIWVIIQSYTIIHDNKIFGSAKFGVDLDANANPAITIYRNDIYNNTFQAVFIEQGIVCTITILQKCILKNYD